VFRLTMGEIDARKDQTVILPWPTRSTDGPAPHLQPAFSPACIRVIILGKRNCRQSLQTMDVRLPGWSSGLQLAGLYWTTHAQDANGDVSRLCEVPSYDFHLTMGSRITLLVPTNIHRLCLRVVEWTVPARRLVAYGLWARHEYMVSRPRLWLANRHAWLYRHAVSCCCLVVQLGTNWNNSTNQSLILSRSGNGDHHPHLLSYGVSGSFQHRCILCSPNA